MFGPKSISENGDTIYHIIPQFEFLDQNGKKVTNKDFQNRIFVADFFFTTCPGICPVMAKQMKRVQDIFLNSDNVRIISYTVDPITDSVQTLRNYARLNGVNDKIWKLVTGEKEKIYSLARQGYFVSATEGDGGDGDFIHTEKFVLVDQAGIIRGYYDGTDSSDVDRLIEHIKFLHQEP